MKAEAHEDQDSLSLGFYRAKMTKRECRVPKSKVFTSLGVKGFGVFGCASWEEWPDPGVSTQSCRVHRPAVQTEPVSPRSSFSDVVSYSP